LPVSRAARWRSSTGFQSAHVRQRGNPVLASVRPNADARQGAGKLLENWNTVSLDEPQVQKLLEGSQASLMFLHRGAAMTNCDWGLKYDDGMGMLMPHMARSRDLARLAALRGRYN
jgi:hypothetical protein